MRVNVILFNQPWEVLFRDERRIHRLQWSTECDFRLHLLKLGDDGF
ncbi:Uncharacterised protein [Vibrio cholerae]|nr:Uncharacterised protein [Vibrio cholerae]